MTDPKSAGDGGEVRLSERLHAKAEADESGCLVWTAARDYKGYGLIQVRGRNCRAHRVAYEIRFGPIPAGMVIDHVCRNRACMNVEHMEVVTPKTNTLRGIGPTAVNARKTHCKHGHEFTDANTYITTRGRRCCRKCQREADRRYKARKAANG